MIVHLKRYHGWRWGIPSLLAPRASRGRGPGGAICARRGHTQRGGTYRSCRRADGVRIVPVPRTASWRGGSIHFHFTIQTIRLGQLAIAACVLGDQNRRRKAVRAPRPLLHSCVEHLTHVDELAVGSEPAYLVRVVQAAHQRGWDTHSLARLALRQELQQTNCGRRAIQGHSDSAKGDWRIRWVSGHVTRLAMLLAARRLAQRLLPQSQHRGDVGMDLVAHEFQAAAALHVQAADRHSGAAKGTGGVHCSDRDVQQGRVLVHNLDCVVGSFQVVVDVFKSSRNAPALLRVPGTRAGLSKGCSIGGEHVVIALSEVFGKVVGLKVG